LKAQLIYPHQLTATLKQGTKSALHVLVEDPLYFCQYPFHKQKLILHRASMKEYEEFLKSKGATTLYLDFKMLKSDSSSIGALLANKGVTEVVWQNPCDDWLFTKVSKGLDKAGIGLTKEESELFVTPLKLLDEYKPKTTTSSMTFTSGSENDLIS
jgi:deoxyribodipyrimidine photolyase-related protein